MKKLLTGIAATALTISPTVATAQSATRAPTQLAPAEEIVDGEELRGQRRGGFILPLLAIVAILVALIATDVIEFGNDNPRSPG